MQLQKESTQAKVIIKNYQPGKIGLNLGETDQVVFLVNGEVKKFEGANNFNELKYEDINLDEKPEILIIGTGEKFQLLSTELVSKINAKGVAVEAMASREACHTYQVLIFDQRIVWALIYP